MAIFNLQITYPDGEQARILTALKDKYQTFDSFGIPIPITNAQVIEAFRQHVAQEIKDIVLAYEFQQATKAVVVIPTNPA